MTNGDFNRPRKPYSPSCDDNKEPILAVLKQYFADRRQVLEIGSGTGQHAVYFSATLPHLIWQASDQPQYLSGIRAWLNDAALPNTPLPLSLDVNSAWPDAHYDAAFSANAFHIMPWSAVVKTFEGLARVLSPGARLVVYGPFNYGGRYTSESNARFDIWLKQGGAHQGVRDFEAVDELARAVGMSLIDDIAMPANNRCLVWDKA